MKKLLKVLAIAAVLGSSTQVLGVKVKAAEVPVVSEITVYNDDEYRVVINGNGFDVYEDGLFLEFVDVGAPVHSIIDYDVYNGVLNVAYSYERPDGYLGRYDVNINVTDVTPPNSPTITLESTDSNNYEDTVRVDFAADTYVSMFEVYNDLGVCVSSYSVDGNQPQIVTLPEGYKLSVWSFDLMSNGTEVVSYYNDKIVHEITISRNKKEKSIRDSSNRKA